VRERHERRVAASPRDAVAAALAMPFAPDPLVRALFRLRGLPRSGSLVDSMRAIGFRVLVSEPECVVLGAAGRPWTPRGGLVPLDQAGPGDARMLLEIAAQEDGGSTTLVTETRVASSKRAFRVYWLVVGPFSALIRRRWLAAAARAAQ
jgi:hypothetical protein